MLHFEPLETTYRVTVNGKNFLLSETEVDNAFWLTADLYDNMHQGPAPVTLGSTTVILSQEQWQDLYDITEAHIQNDIEENEIVGAIVYH